MWVVIGGYYFSMLLLTPWVFCSPHTSLIQNTATAGQAWLVGTSLATFFYITTAWTNFDIWLTQIVKVSILPENKKHAHWQGGKMGT